MMFPEPMHANDTERLRAAFRRQPVSASLRLDELEPLEPLQKAHGALVGDPEGLHWQVLMGVERFEDESTDMEGDAYPEEGQPPAYYELVAEYD